MNMLPSMLIAATMIGGSLQVNIPYAGNHEVLAAHLNYRRRQKMFRNNILPEVYRSFWKGCRSWG